MTRSDGSPWRPQAAPRESPPAAGSGRLWLVRHARVLIEPNVCYGATDVAADPQHTAATAHELASVVPSDALIHCSPLRRCTELADALVGLRPDLQCRQEPRIAEMDFGCWEGTSWADIPRTEIDRWTAQFASLRFGGVESVQQMMQRVRAAWIDCQGVTGRHVWLTHAGVIRCAMLLARGAHAIVDASQWPAEPIAFGSVRELHWPA